jgi:hypothetical protein
MERLSGVCSPLLPRLDSSCCRSVLNESHHHATKVFVGSKSNLSQLYHIHHIMEQQDADKRDKALWTLFHQPMKYRTG